MASAMMKLESKVKKAVAGKTTFTKNELELIYETLVGY
jgi:hypothetical protein